MRQSLLNFWLYLILSGITLCGIVRPVFGQDREVYATKEGSMRLLFQKTNVDSGIVADTRSLKVQFNYDVPKMRFRARLARFQCADSALQKGLRQLASPEIRFEGDMNIRSLKDEPQPEVIFPIEGTLTINGKREYVKLNGNLFPMAYANNYQAQLHVSTRLTLSQFGLKRHLPNYRDRFYIVIRQSVLRPKP